MKDFLENNYISVILTSKLFEGIGEKECLAMLSCLDAKLYNCPKGSFLLHVGDSPDSIGLVLCGSVLVIREDVWGNRNILSKVLCGQTFGAAYACAPKAMSDVSVVAETPVTVMYLNVKRILNVCSLVCEHHNRIVQNLLGELAEKNLRFSEKLTHICQRTTRAKLMSYFSAQAQRLNKKEFDIPFSRQQLADYLAVERSGLSMELSKMKADGLIDYHKNHFLLKV